MFITGVNDTGNKLFSSFNDTGEKFINLCHGFSVIAGVVDTGEQFITGDNDTGNNFVAGDNDTGEQLSPVTTTPAINLLPDTRTRTPLRWGAAKERRKLKGINRRFLRPPKSAAAADGVIGTAMKSCIQKHPTHLDQRPLRPPKLNNAVLVCSSFGGLRGLRACEGPLRLFVAVLMTISAALANFGGRGRLRRPEIVLQQEQTSVINTVYRRCRFPGVIDTGHK